MAIPLVPPQAFSILTSDRLTATDERNALGSLQADFQYPDLGSFDCNYVFMLGLQSASLGFQYPDLGSFDCNTVSGGRRARRSHLSVS